MKVAIIGAGAAGFFTAINIAEKNPAVSVTLFEAGGAPLRKVRISGGGRCNVTHSCFEPRELVTHYPRGKKELLGLFHKFQPEDTIAWFEKRRLTLKTEADGRLFPASNDSQSVIDVFVREAHRLGIDLKTGKRVTYLVRDPDKDGFLLTLSIPKGREAKPTKHFDKVVITTGYSPVGWKLAESLGHTILPVVPSLFPFRTAESVFDGLQGLTLTNVVGKLKTPAMKKPLEATGDLLVTHGGVSGPLVYRLSAWGARELAENSYQADLRFDFCPDKTAEALRRELDVLAETDWALIRLYNSKFSGVPFRLWQALLEESGAPMEERGKSLGKKPKNKLVELLKQCPVQIVKKNPSKEEFVSCGGVKRSEINFLKMESKRCPGLYFAGEVIDMDGLTGGFNFQACWSAGWVISESFLPA